MAADGWFSQWFAGAWFPPVWFAPADESAIPPEELSPSGGGHAVVRKGRKANRPAWVIPQKFAKPQRRNVEEAESLLLIGVL